MKNEIQDKGKESAEARQATPEGASETQSNAAAAAAAAAMPSVTAATRMLPPRKRVSAALNAVRLPSSTVSPSSAGKVAFFSPRSDTTDYLEQLDDIPESDVRGGPLDRAAAASSSCSSTYGKKLNARLASSFNELNVPPPVPSKRQRHLEEAKEPPPRSRIHHARQKHERRLRQQQQKLEEEQQQEGTVVVSEGQQQQKQKQPATPSSSSSSSIRRARGPEFAYPREALKVPLTQDDPVVDDTVMDDKAKEKEYWRRQRRVFARSRFITNDEATVIANSVYKSNPVDPQHKFVTTFQANIANFRSKWRKILKELATLPEFASLTREQITDDEAILEQTVASKVDRRILQKVWGHWITEPFVDRDLFYANSQAVESLTKVTTLAICVTLRHQLGNMKERDFRKSLDDLDKYTRDMYLPDPTV